MHWVSFVEVSWYLHMTMTQIWERLSRPGFESLTRRIFLAKESTEAEFEPSNAKLRKVLVSVSTTSE